MKLTSLIAFSVLVATASFASEKGAEKLAARKVSDPGVARSSMTCQTETRTAIDSSARGAFKSASVYTVHACPSCTTKEATQGAGKLATRKLVHTCAQASVCCAGK